MADKKQIDEAYEAYLRQLAAALDKILTPPQVKK